MKLTIENVNKANENIEIIKNGFNKGGLSIYNSYLPIVDNLEIDNIKTAYDEANVYITYTNEPNRKYFVSPVYLYDDKTVILTSLDYIFKFKYNKNLINLINYREGSRAIKLDSLTEILNFNLEFQNYIERNLNENNQKIKKIIMKINYKVNIIYYNKNFKYQNTTIEIRDLTNENNGEVISVSSDRVFVLDDFLIIKEPLMLTYALYLYEDSDNLERLLLFKNI